MDNTGNMNLNIKPEDMKDVNCDECEGQTFVPVFLFKEVSAVVSPNGKKSLVPMQIFKCDSCSHINDAFLPKKKKEDKGLKLV